MSSLTSVELNFLIFRYLQESGFTHAAFTLGYEAGINKSNIDGNMVPPGALIKFVQKGLQYMEMEANLNNDEMEMEEDFSFFQPLDLISKDVKELQDMLKERKRKEKVKEKERSKENDKEVEREHEGERNNRAKEKDRHEKQKEREREREKMERDKEREREKTEREREKMERETFDRERERLKLEMERGREREKIEREKAHEKQIGDGDREMLIDQTEKENAIDQEHGRSTAAEPMDSTMTSTSQPSHIPSSDVRILEGHTSEVCACAWSPSASLLASGSGDATARIWSIPEGSFKSGAGRSINALILKHANGKSNEKSKDVTTLDWNGEGTFLATGSCDGQARIWTTTGELISTLSKHKGPIFSLKWNKKGDYLLTGSVDKTAVVWDVKAEEWKQQFEFHTGPTLDVDWRNNVSFATSSTDSMIYLCKIGETRPVRIFAGHQGEVNCVKWDPTGSLLASCSDDSTAKIWNIKQNTYVHDLREHTKEIYTIRWSPTGTGTNNPNKQLTLASASFDSTVKLWDAELGKMLCSFNGHREPVYSLAFSPNGEYIASGSLDKSIHIWSIKEGKIMKTYTGNGGIFEVCWNKEGNKIAACFADNSVCVLDFRM